MWHVVHEIMHRVEDPATAKAGVLVQTGPKMLTAAVRDYQRMFPDSSISILRHATGESKLIYPYDADHQSSKNGKELREELSSSCTIADDCASRYPDAYAMHHFAGSWWPAYKEQFDL